MAPWQDFLKNNSDTLLQTGMGLIGGRTASEQASMGLQGFQQGRKMNRTMQFLQEKNPELAQAVQSGALDAGDAFKIHMQQQAEASKPKNPWMAVGGSLFNTENQSFLTPPEKPADLPSSVDEYNFAKSQGFNGSYMDYKAAQKPVTNINNVQLPAEVGARIGLGDKFLADVPTIEAEIKAGKTNGIMGGAALAAGVGDAGSIWRKIETGRDALVRNLTGAGMSVSEAENMASRYQIGPMDSQATQLDKLNGLAEDLKAVRSGAIGAKTGTMGQTPMPSGVISAEEFFK